MFLRHQQTQQLDHLLLEEALRVLQRHRIATTAEEVRVTAHLPHHQDPLRIAAPAHPVLAHALVLQVALAVEVQVPQAVVEDVAKI